MRRALLLAIALLTVVTVPARAGANGCTDRTGPQRYVVGQYRGYVAFPEETPTALVVFFHGYGHDAADWAGSHLERVASENGAVAVAMDYPGTDAERTWQVREGAESSVAAARALRLRCKPAQTVAYGVSMGANASGLALASSPGLFDWWIAVEGAHNVIETYLEATVVAESGNAFAVEAKRGIELEMGGATFQEDPGTYQRHTNVLLAEKIASSGIKGVFMVHGVGDGLVPYDQSREMAERLRALRVPVEVATATLRGEGEPGTTVDGHVTGQLPEELRPVSPFAGHATETSTTHVVGREGFTRLASLLAGTGIVDSERVI